jgi:hypothetical protein
MARARSVLADAAVERSHRGQFVAYQRGCGALKKGRFTGAKGTCGMTHTKVIPDMHEGIHYYDFMSELSRKRDVKRYLEIGVNAGGLMSRVHASIAVGVDPQYVLSSDVTKNKKVVSLVQETSDRFFESYDYAAMAGGPPELCFLDGLHIFEYLLRDFINTEAICSAKSLICMHDCLPLNDTMIMRSVEESLAASSTSTQFKGWWTGDVWKIVPILQEYRPDLKLVLVDSFPTGVACVTNLDPTNKILQHSYLDIVGKYKSMGDDLVSLSKLYSSIEVVSAASVLNNWDNTSFFRT